MKQLLLLLLFCLSFIAANCQQLLWERTVSTSTDYPLEYTTLPDGGFAAVYAVNTFFSSLVRFDSLGFEVWNHPFPTDMRVGHSMLKVVPGGILVGLSKADSDTTRLALVKVNWQGDEVWTKIIPTGRNYNAACDLLIKSPNEYILMVAGTNTDQTLGDGGGAKFLTFSIDSTGITNWRKIYLNPLLTIDYPRNIIRYKSEGYLFTGGNGFYPRVIKTNEVGDTVQSKFLTDPASSLYVTQWGNYIPVSDGNVVFTGFNMDNDLANRFLLVSKMDTALNILWTVTHQEAGNNFASSNVLELADSTLLVVTQKHGDNKIILLKISPQGQVVDTSYVTVSNMLYPLSLMNAFLLPDGSLIYGGKDYLVKIGDVGVPMPPTVFPPPVGLPEDLLATGALGFAFPNPAESMVTLPYRLPAGTKVASIQISELATGRLVKQVPLNPETEQVKVDLRNFLSGLYSYTLLIDGAPVATKKLAVIK